MLDVTGMHAAVRQSVRLWTEDRHSEALSLLDGWISQAEREGEIAWLDMLCGQASMIAASASEHSRVKDYNEKILSHENESVVGTCLAHYRLANALFHEGQAARAKHHAATAFGLVAHPTTDEERGLQDLLIKCWPEIGAWKS